MAEQERIRPRRTKQFRIDFDPDGDAYTNLCRVAREQDLSLAQVIRRSMANIAIFERALFPTAQSILERSRRP